MASLWDWLWSWLSETGLVGKKGRVVLLGLDNAGKTTLMHMLRDNLLVQHMPTQKPTMETFTLGGLTFSMHDLGGHTVARRLWDDYCVTASGIVYVIDVGDRERVDEARAVFAELMVNDVTRSLPVAVLGNKIDVPGALSEAEARHLFGLGQTVGQDATKAEVGAVRPVELFMCSIAKRQGYKEAFQWLSRFI
jgi:GTP-binding protein SAR1